MGLGSVATEYGFLDGGEVDEHIPTEPMVKIRNGGNRESIVEESVSVSVFT